MNGSKKRIVQIWPICLRLVFLTRRSKSSKEGSKRYERKEGERKNENWGLKKKSSRRVSCIHRGSIFEQLMICENCRTLYDWNCIWKRLKENLQNTYSKQESFTYLIIFKNLILSLSFSINKYLILLQYSNLHLFLIPQPNLIIDYFYFLYQQLFVYIYYAELRSSR